MADARYKLPPNLRPIKNCEQSRRSRAQTSETKSSNVIANNNPKRPMFYSTIVQGLHQHARLPLVGFLSGQESYIMMPHE